MKKGFFLSFEKPNTKLFIVESCYWIAMTKVRLALLAFGLVALIAVSGCILPEAEAVNRVKENPAVQDFLESHPNSELTILSWTSQESQERKLELVQKCGPQILATNYYYISLREGPEYLEAWVYQKTGNLACVYRSDDQCITNASCEDNDPCTLNACSGTPKKCSSKMVTQCIGNDSCCPTGCSYAVDSDCPQPECMTDSDCDDENPGTVDICSGIPKKCSYQEIELCVDGDNYCPKGCNYSSDKDCETGECESDEDCDDNDGSTEDICEGTPKTCRYRKITECTTGDGYCPKGCDRKTDRDCFVQAGEKAAIVVECKNHKTMLTGKFYPESGNIKATIKGVANSSNNEAMQAFENQAYTYNWKKGLTSMSERLFIRGKAIFDREQGTYFQFNKNGLIYEISFDEGIPATEIPTGTKEFEVESEDTVEIPFFGDDAFVIKASNIPGQESITVVSDGNQLSTKPGQIARAGGKNGEDYGIRISGCTENETTFGLWKGEEQIASQKASPGDRLFKDELEQVFVVSGTHWESGTGLCDFRYIKGNYLETLKQGENYPEESDWQVSLEFKGKKLTKISLENKTISFEDPLQVTDVAKVLPFGESTGKHFCTIKFRGILR